MANTIPRVGVANTQARTAAAPQPAAYKPKDYTGWNMQQANDWRNQVEQEMNRRRGAGQDVTNWQKHYGDVNNYIRTLRGTPPPTGGPATDGTPQTTPPAATQPSSPYVVPNTLDRQGATVRYQEAANRLKGLQKGTPEYERNAQILQGIGNKFGFRWQDQLGADWKPAATPQVGPPLTEDTQPTTPTTPETPTPATPETPANPPTAENSFNWDTYESPMTKALKDSFAQQMTGLAEYGNRFYENNPFYNQAKQEGMRALDRKLAAQGLAGSGAAIEGQNDFMARLMAAESEKQRQWAGDTADRAQQGMKFIAEYDQSERDTLRDQANKNTDRGIDLSQFDATRNDAWRNLQLNTLMGVLGLQAQTSPMNDIYKALGAQNDTLKEIGNKLAAFQANDYIRATPARSGGGAAIPPPPPAADNTNLAIIQALMNRNNAGGNNSVLNTILGGLTGFLGGGK